MKTHGFYWGTDDTSTCFFFGLGPDNQLELCAQQQKERQEYELTQDKKNTARHLSLFPPRSFTTHNTAQAFLYNFALGTRENKDIDAISPRCWSATKPREDRSSRAGETRVLYWSSFVVEGQRASARFFRVRPNSISTVNYVPSLSSENTSGPPSMRIFLVRSPYMLIRADSVGRDRGCHYGRRPFSPGLPWSLSQHTPTWYLGRATFV